MKILANNAPWKSTYAKYARSGKFDPEQLEAIWMALNEGMGDKKIQVIADPELRPHQMIMLSRIGLYSPLSLMVVAADPRLSDSQIDLLYRAYCRDLSIEAIAEMANPEYSTAQMRCIQWKHLDLLDSATADYLVNANITSSAIDSFLDRAEDYGISLDDVRRLVEPNYPVRFVEGLAFWCDTEAAESLEQIYFNYPDVFDQLDRSQLDLLCCSIENNWSYIAAHVLPYLRDTEYTKEQAKEVLYAIIDLEMGCLSWNTFTRVVDPKCSAEEMQKLRSEG